MAASVWMAGKTVAGSFAASPCVVTGRLRALMMPVVTVLSRPNGEPTATTCWPTFEVVGVAEGRRGQAADAVGLDDREIGQWVAADDVALAVVPSLKLTASEPPLAASSTTWLLVRIWPSSVRMIPEPEPLSLRPAARRS